MNEATNFKFSPKLKTTMTKLLDFLEDRTAGRVPEELVGFRGNLPDHIKMEM